MPSGGDTGHRAPRGPLHDARGGSVTLGLVLFPFITQELFYFNFIFY